MADEPATTTTTTEPDPPTERTVPYDRFKAVNDQVKELRDKLNEEAERRQELEDKDKSEVERLTAALQKAETDKAKLGEQVEQLNGKLASNERKGWVRDAAAKANFIDPADAFGRVDLSAIESEADAKEAVKKVAADAKHLIAPEQPAAPTVGQVVKDGQVVQPGQPSADPHAEENAKFLAELKEASQSGWSTSTTGLIETP